MTIRRPNSPRGMTLLEAIFAMATLGVVVAGLLSAMSFVQGETERERRRLGAAELAHRLVLQYMDDRRAVRTIPEHISYGRDQYRWRLNARDLRIENLVRTTSSSRVTGSSRRDIDRFKVLEVEVWLSEESGGAVEPIPGVPYASLSRAYDTLPQNPDALSTLIDDPEGMGIFIETVLDNGGP